MRYLKLFLCAGLAAMLAGCGGGGGNPGTTSGGTGGTGGTTNIDASVAGFVYQLDKPALTNSGSDAVKITVVALDANNNPVGGAGVQGSVDSGIYRAMSKVTDNTGQYVSTVEIGGDKTNRTITASITVNGVVKKVIIPVIGSRVVVTPAPTNPSPGQAYRVDLRVVDARDVGISGVPVELGGNAGFSGTVTTDINGNVSASAVAPSVSGSYRVTAASSGVTGAADVQVVTPGGSTIPPADLRGTTLDKIAASLTANPTSVAPNTDGGTTSSSRLSAKFLGPGNAGIENMRVRFEIVPPALGAGEYIKNPGDNTKPRLAGAGGVVDADYIPGTRTSPTNGVVLRAYYSDTDAGLADTVTPPPYVEATLTVNSQPLAISIGNHNKMTKGLGGIAYLEQFLIQVVDASGVAVKDAVVSASVDITHYGKGVWGAPYPVTVPTKADKFPVDVEPGEMNVWCDNEDINRNGTLEVGEDTNKNGSLEPGKSEIALSYVNGQKTDASGQLLIQLSYPQNVGGWLAYTIKATTSVVGSEGTKERSFVTAVLEEDKKNGSFLTPPYGSHSCNKPN